MVCRELLLLVVFLLLLPLPDTRSISDCCPRRGKCSCKLHQLLYGSGNHGAGILTVGRRNLGTRGARLVVRSSASHSTRKQGGNEPSRERVCSSTPTSSSLCLSAAASRTSPSTG
ncbi:hypothetical protein chiPu_0005965 [Chiloscyllium punctatum]|uniref:Hypocretin neuropeptide precursor n=1 Tax=Chiloscyllium punctatum TaxID=137246 RepID=A0A401SAZ4_CHIPU|nr:hypothetical protein [Chiloscyllium punctatum]